MKKILITIILAGLATSAVVYTQLTKHETNSTAVGSQVWYGHTPDGGIAPILVGSDGTLQVAPSATPIP